MRAGQVVAVLGGLPTALVSGCSGGGVQRDGVAVPGEPLDGGGADGDGVRAGLARLDQRNVLAAGGEREKALAAG